MSETKRIQIRRGLQEDLPDLREGEPALCTDTEEVYVGTATTNNIKLAKAGDVEELSSKVETLEENVTTQLEAKADQSFVDAQLASIVSGAPKATFSTVLALQNAYPNGTDGVFLVLANGHWYYWNSNTNAWTDGGVYQATGLIDGSVTEPKILNGAVTEQKIGYSYRRGEILSSSINVDTVNKNVSIPGTCYIGVNGKYYTVSAQTVAFTGLITRVNFVYLNVNNLALEVYESGLAPNTSNLVLLFSFYNGEVQNTTTGKRITLDGGKASNILSSKNDMAYRFGRASILAGTVTVTHDTVAKTGSVVCAGLQVSLNGSFVNIPNTTLNYTFTSNRVNYVYIKEGAGTIHVYENGLAPNDPFLTLLFSYYNNNVFNCDAPKGITINGAKPLNTTLTKADTSYKFQRASILAGTIYVTVDTVAKTGKVETVGLQISKNGVYNVIADTTINYNWTSNRIQYVYVKENTNSLVVYENGLAPEDPYLILLFSYYNGNVFNCDNTRGIVYNGKTLGAEVSPTNKLYGAKANFLGDSITDDNHTAATVKYHKLIQERYGLALVRNYGIAGSRITVGNTDSMATRYVDMDNDADYIVVFAGTNDCGGGQTLENFRASVKTLFSGLIDKYPTKKILIVTPLQSSYANRIEALKAYVDIEIEEAAYYGLPVLDLHRHSGISSRNTSQINALMPDGLHPNNQGHEQIAMKIGEAMRAL